MKRVELLLRRREARLSLSSVTLYGEQGRPLQQECVHTTCFSAGLCECIFFLSQMCLYFTFFFF